MARLFAAAFIGRLPVGMYSLATVLVISEASGSFALAGAAVGAFAIAGAFSAPVLGRLIDRIGQPPVLIACAFAFPASVAALIAVADGGAAEIPVLACAVATGIAFPPLFATLRALISDLGGALVETAYALDAIVQELFFVCGPLLVALIVGVATAEVALGVAAALVAAGTLAFATTAASRASRQRVAARPRAGALASPGVRTIVLTTSVVDGLVFGTLQVALAAFGEEQGSAGASGVMLGALALGSALGGFWYGARRWSRDPADLLVVFAWLLALGLMPLALAGSIPVMTVLLLIAGLFIAPSAAASFALVGRLSPEGAVTEGFTWLSTAVTFGFAFGGAVAGQLVERASVDAALLATAGLAVAAAGILYARRGTLRVGAGLSAGR